MRCPNCGRLLLKVSSLDLPIWMQIKCPRCKNIAKSGPKSP